MHLLDLDDPLTLFALTIVLLVLIWAFLKYVLFPFVGYLIALIKNTDDVSSPPLPTREESEARYRQVDRFRDDHTSGT